MTPTQRAILVDLLVYGADKADNIGYRTGNHRNTVSKYTGDMVDSGHLSAKGGGVYRLTDKGRTAAQGLIRAGEIPYPEADEAPDKPDECKDEEAEEEIEN